MGVPLEHVEAEDPYFSGDTDDEDDDEGEEEGENSIKSEDSVSTASSKPKEEYVHGLGVEGGSAEDPALSSLSLKKDETSSGQSVTQGRMSTRSQTGSVSSKTRDVTSGKENIYRRQYNTEPMIAKRKLGPKPAVHVPLKPDSLKLSDGIAKITPPVGWWDKAGIGKDTTGRGDPWQKGTQLGDLMIPNPIKQCVSGIGGIYDFTMMELPTISVAGFREKADQYRKSQLGKEVDMDESDDHMDELARKFWKRLGPTMQSSLYGADMEGTLFDGAEACGWNVNQLESCLALLEADYKEEGDLSERFRLPGVTSAYLYFGMWASVFSAHTEDMNLLSINYLHAGAPKYWYAIAQEDSHRFESLMKSTFSHQAIACKEFLRHKRSLLSPSLLSKAGISYTTQVQRAGDIIITFPGSYHFGFNTGFNCAESTNFAVPEWVPYGEKANICMCHPHSVRIDMRRFKSLLDQYENDVLQTNGPKLSYSQWAKEYIKRKRKRSSQTTVGTNIEKESSSGGKLKPFIVEVMKLSSRRYHRDIDTVNKENSKRVKGKGKKMIEMEEYHIVMPMKASNMKPQTQVICLLDTDNDIECYFAGVIVDVIENHAKIHFAGSTRNEDVWLTINSGKLFLDGGVASNPSCEKKIIGKGETILSI